MRLRTLFLVPFLALPFVVTASCGGGGSDGGFPLVEASTDAAPTYDAPLGCPATLPEAGGGCAPLPLQCEYGEFDFADCNTFATCTRDGWSLSGPRIANCRNQTLCPATVPTPGETCTAYGTCFWRDRTCFCKSPGPSVWECDERPKDCPTERPFWGTTCTEEGKLCDYSACGVIENTQQRCVNGVWRFESAECDGG